MTENLSHESKRSNYRSYLLHLWRADDCDDQRATWRASLQNAFSDEQTFFANPDDLIGFLRRLTSVVGGAGAEDCDASVCGELGRLPPVHSAYRNSSPFVKRKTSPTLPLRQAECSSTGSECSSKAEIGVAASQLLNDATKNGG